MARARPTATLLLVLACGDQDTGSESLTIDYQLFKRGQNVSCENATEVREVEVTLFAENGITPRVGWPRKVPCNGSFEAGVEAGNYILQVVGLGELQGDPNAALYKSRTPLTIPSAPVTLSLSPEVAFLDLSWTFGESMLAPCATEVANIDVLVSAGSDPYTGRFPCQATPLRIEEPFSLQNYSIQVIANSEEGFPLFTADMQRTLDRGLNEYTAVLRPMGGRVTIDFSFQTGPVNTRFCDDPAVNATDLRATIRSLEGGSTVSETFSCMETRPYAFKSARFTPGRLLELALVAEANERFKGLQSFTMPTGDHSTGVMTLVPVGTGTVTVEVASSTCAGAVERFDVTVRPRGLNQVVLESVIEPPLESVALIDLPYGSYDVTVEEIIGGAVECTADGLRTVVDRENDWDPFVF